MVSSRISSPKIRTCSTICSDALLELYARIVWALILLGGVAHNGCEVALLDPADAVFDCHERL